jgi:hypothetical protein
MCKGLYEFDRVCKSGSPSSLQRVTHQVASRGQIRGASDFFNPSNSAKANSIILKNLLPKFRDSGNNYRRKTMQKKGKLK